MKFAHPVHIEEGSYDPQVFYERVKGMEKLPEGGERCFKCYRCLLYTSPSPRD